MSWFYDPRFRKWAAQALVLFLLCLGVYELIVNTSANLARLNQDFGFDFLSRAAGFDLSTSLLPYSSNSSYSRALLVGFWNTALVSIVGVFLASILGFTIGVMRLSQNSVVSAFAGVYIEIVRNIPLLLQIFIWYALVLKPLPEARDAIKIWDIGALSNKGLTLPAPVFPAIWYFRRSGYMFLAISRVFWPHLAHSISDSCDMPTSLASS
jgi:general L-amino acid transport system permease protein